VPETLDGKPFDFPAVCGFEIVKNVISLISSA
jgi:hypothetical protein